MWDTTASLPSPRSSPGRTRHPLYRRCRQSRRLGGDTPLPAAAGGGAGGGVVVDAGAVAVAVAAGVVGVGVDDDLIVPQNRAKSPADKASWLVGVNI